MSLISNAMNLVSEVLDYVKESRDYRLKTKFHKLLRRLHELESKQPHERIDGEIDRLYIELDDFIRVFRSSIKADEVSK